MPNVLNHSPAVIVAQLLVDLGLAVAPSYAVGQDGIVSYSGQPWPAFSTSEPDFPDEVVTVYDQLGTNSGRFQFSGALQEFYGLQARIRSLDHDGGWIKADSIRRAWAAAPGQPAPFVYDRTVTVLGSVYLVSCFSNVKEVMILGKDSPDTKRSLFTVNAQARIDVFPITS